MVLMPHLVPWRAQAALAADDDRYNEAETVQISFEIEVAASGPRKMATDCGSW